MFFEGHHVRRCPIFHPISSEYKKVSSRSRGARAVYLGGPSVYQEGGQSLNLSNKSRCLQKSKLVDWRGRQACRLRSQAPLGADPVTSADIRFSGGRSPPDVDMITQISAPPYLKVLPTPLGLHDWYSQNLCSDKRCH